jgi:ribosomal protein L32
MSDIVCPQCGQVTTFASIRRASDEFCSHCDFPLFWAPSAVPVGTASTNSGTTLRRLPGAGGRQMIGTKVCPTCGELNSISAIVCIRCGNDMEPKPPEPPPPPPPPPPPAAPPPPPAKDYVPIVIMAIIAVITAAGAVLML